MRTLSSSADFAKRRIQAFANYFSHLSFSSPLIYFFKALDDCRWEDVFRSVFDTTFYVGLKGVSFAVAHQINHQQLLEQMPKLAWVPGNRASWARYVFKNGLTIGLEGSGGACFDALTLWVETTEPETLRNELAGLMSLTEVPDSWLLDLKPEYMLWTTHGLHHLNIVICKR